MYSAYKVRRWQLFGVLGRNNVAPGTWSGQLTAASPGRAAAGTNFATAPPCMPSDLAAVAAARTSSTLACSPEPTFSSFQQPDRRCIDLYCIHHCHTFYSHRCSSMQQHRKNTRTKPVDDLREQFRVRQLLGGGQHTPSRCSCCGRGTESPPCASLSPELPADTGSGTCRNSLLMSRATSCDLSRCNFREKKRKGQQW